MKTMLPYLIRSAVAAGLLAVAGCASIPVQTYQTSTDPTYPATDPAAVQILRRPPARPHLKLGEISAVPRSSGTPVAEVEARLREAAAKLGADAVVLVMETTFTEAAVSDGWYDRDRSPNVGQAFIGVPIRYTQQQVARAAQDH